MCTRTILNTVEDTISVNSKHVPTACGKNSISIQLFISVYFSIKMMSKCVISVHLNSYALVNWFTHHLHITSWWMASLILVSIRFHPSGISYTRTNINFYAILYTCQLLRSILCLYIAGIYRGNVVIFDPNLP